MVVRGPESWTEERVDRFWHHMAERGLGYFSAFNAQGIVRVLELAGGLEGRILDWGCGSGALLEAMVARGATACGADASPTAVRHTSARLAGYASFGGAYLVTEVDTKLAAGSFDAVTCIETVEHVDDGALGRLLAQIRRLLCDGGTLLVSTPNEEDLVAAAVYCPFCDSSFHPMQHLRTWSAASLAQVLDEAGFAVRFCGGIRFESFQRWSAFEGSSTEVLRVLRANLLGRLDPLWRLADTLLGRQFPHTLEFRVRQGEGRHLCAVARKR